jgi:hypothetical protein
MIANPSLKAMRREREGLPRLKDLSYEIVYIRMRPCTSVNRTSTCIALDHRSFRTQLAFSIGFAVTRSRDLLRRCEEHAPDDARQVLAKRALEHLELSVFEIDEGEAGYEEAPAEFEPWLGRRLGFCLLERAWPPKIT